MGTYLIIRSSRAFTHAWLGQYNDFMGANTRYEQHLAETRESGDFPFPPGHINKYEGKHIKNVPQDAVWWALRPANQREGWVRRSNVAYDV